MPDRYAVRLMSLSDLAIKVKQKAVTQQHAELKNLMYNVPQEIDNVAD